MPFCAMQGGKGGKALALRTRQWGSNLDASIYACYDLKRAFYKLAEI